MNVRVLLTNGIIACQLHPQEGIAAVSGTLFTKGWNVIVGSATLENI